MQGVAELTLVPYYPDEFGAKIFKISRDQQGNRLTHMKITGGKLKVKDALSNGDWEEKVNQIRIYSGHKYDAVQEIEAGTVCAVTGLTQARPGEGLGIEESSNAPILEPVLSYQLVLPEGCDPRGMLPKIRQLEDEEPALHVVWDEQSQQIQLQVMGAVQIEILQSLIKERFDIEASFDTGRIVYKETIGNIVEGVGHFEPLRHYAEVHLLLEPGEPGSGLQFESICSEDVLAKSWQNLILTHLKEKQHKGVLTGSNITDMKITLVSGRAHNRHTEGGDFREATYRAVRQGLKEGESVLLEPYYTFRLETPENMVGKAMTDIEMMHGSCRISETDGETAVLEGSAPVINMRNYQQELLAYTKGLGRLFCSLKGYEPCRNQQEVIEMIGYDSERDVENPTGSVFCAQGSSFIVSWDEVKEYMHVESYLLQKEDFSGEATISRASYAEEEAISLEEIDEIFNKTFYANQGKKALWKGRKTAKESYYQSTYAGREIVETKEDYLLVDGYNIIFAWPELEELAHINMDGARINLIDILSNYLATEKGKVTVVFDAYRAENQLEKSMDYENIHVIYTKEGQTADQYIERFAHENRGKYHITVATSDALQQSIVRGLGGSILSARELKEKVDQSKLRVMNEYEKQKEGDPEQKEFYRIATRKK
jgi:ribosomal protection tetracycline resistance protein